MNAIPSPGVFRRRVAIVTRAVADGSAQARCVVEDDFHHFRVIVSARNGAVTAVSHQALRTPNTLCDAAGGRLGELVGMVLDPASSAVVGAADQFQQCTHQFDLAGLGVAALALGRPRRVYDVTVPDRVGERTRAVLAADGVDALVWDVEDMTVLGPEPYSGRSLGAGFTRFTRSLPQEEAEAALVMRRALFVSRGRGVNFDEIGQRGPVGGCWAWQPERMDRLRRQPENRRDFTEMAGHLLLGDDDWLEFRA